jgi:RHS repeat-associated protein
MVGEQTDGGTRINYVTDALGSIVQAIDENRDTTYTARYKPFGDVLSSTGTAPAFTWVGSLGYLQAAGRPHSAFYVRARFYSKAEGRWTTVDALWPNESAYMYVRCRPSWRVDPSGTQQLPQPGPGYGNYCGPRSGHGGKDPVVDPLDACCKTHDSCLASFFDWLDPCKYHCDCDLAACARAAGFQCLLHGDLGCYLASGLIATYANQVCLIRTPGVLVLIACSVADSQ